jgi:hypothetical protein
LVDSSKSEKETEDMRKTLLIAVVLALVMLMPLSTIVMAANPTVEIFSGNIVDAAGAGYSGYYFYKFPELDGDPVVSGTYNQDGHYVHWTVSADGTTLSFDSASPGLAAVVVKAGNGGYVYKYNPAAASGSGLVGLSNKQGIPHGISHVVFIWGTGSGPLLPELPAGLLLGLGLAGVGTFIVIKKRRGTVSAG